MLLPVLNISDAAAIWDARNNTSEINLNRVTLDYVGEGDEHISDLELATLVDDLRTVRLKYDGKNMKSVGGQIDSEIIRPVHSFFDALAEPFQLGRVGFWCWLSNIAHDGYFWDFIKWRLGGNKPSIGASQVKRGLLEVYFYRAWLRGHKMLEPNLENPYEYAERVQATFGDRIFSAKILAVIRNLLRPSWIQSMIKTTKRSSVQPSFEPN